TGINQLPPDDRKVIQLRAEQVDSLPTCDFGIQIKLLGYLPEDNQFVGSDFATGNPRNYRIGSVLLHIGHKMVVGVLQVGQLVLHDQIVPAARHNGRDCRFTDITAKTLSMTAYQLIEATDFFDLDQVIELLTRMVKVLAQISVDFYPQLGELTIHQLCRQLHAATATSTGTGFGFDLTDSGSAGLHRA